MDTVTIASPGVRPVTVITPSDADALTPSVSQVTVSSVPVFAFSGA